MSDGRISESDFPRPAPWSVVLVTVGVVVGLSLVWAEISPWLSVAWVVAYLLGFAAGRFAVLLIPALLVAYFALPAVLEPCGPDSYECLSGAILGGSWLLGGSFALAMLAGILARRYLRRST